MSFVLPQVFDHPSVTAITSYIGSLGITAGSAAAAEDSSGDESDGAGSIHDFDMATSAALPLHKSLPVPGGSQAALIGISSLACKTAASNAVTKLPGVDASRRVPVSRWEVEKQEQVSTVTCLFSIHPRRVHVYASGSV